MIYHEAHEDTKKNHVHREDREGREEKSEQGLWVSDLKNFPVFPVFL